MTFPSFALRFALGTALLVGASPALADDGDDNCRQVRGRFASVPAAPCDSPVGICTDGTLGGSLSGGDYAFVMNTMAPTPEASVPFVQFFTGESTITLRDGTVLRGVDAGAMNGRPPGEPGSGAMSMVLTVVEGGEGYLRIRGALNLATGEAQGRYEGEICVAE